MNGIHDMGGMHGMGPIRHERNEPVFHARWEGRVFAIDRAVRGRWNGGVSRYQRELIPCAEYLRMSYAEQTLVRTTELMIKVGLITPAEAKSGRPAQGAKKSTPTLPLEKVQDLVTKGVPASRKVPVTAKFKVGDHVRARNINPVGHTRLPRYARGKLGTVERDHGVFVFPDTNAELRGEKPQHVYTVRFAARELWGDQARLPDAVYLDMWDDYLELA